MTRFRNHRNESFRKTNWNYSAGVYFVTILTKYREHYFGEIHDNKMKLSQMGEFAVQEWLKTPEVRSDMNVRLGEFVAMPDHFHGIICLGPSEYSKNDEPLSYGPQKKNLASVIRGFKSAVTMHARNNKIEFNWHNSYYDQTITDLDHYFKVSGYIKTNPLRWSRKKP